MNSECSVLFVVDRLRFGGSEMKAVRLANVFAALGYKVGISFWGNENDIIDNISDNVLVFDAVRIGWRNPFSLVALSRFVYRERFQNVISMGLFAGMLSKISINMVPYTINEFICVNMSIPTIKVQKRMGFYNWLFRDSHIVFGANEQARKWREDYGFQACQRTVIHNGVNTNYFTPYQREEREAMRTVLGYTKDDIVIVTVAALRPEKAITDLVDALVRLVENDRPVHLLVVGDGEERNNIIEYANKLKVGERLHVVGFTGDVRPYLAVGDIFSLPSRSVETFSNAALEAMSMGLPAVLSDIGGAKEMIREGDNGFVFPPGDVDSLFSILDQLISSQGMLIMGARARSRTVNEFSFESMVDSYRALMQHASK